MGLLAMMDMSDGERMEHAVQSMEPSQLPPLLRLLAAVLGNADADDSLGLLDLAGESAQFGRFLLDARPELAQALEQLQASIAGQMVRGHRGPLTSMVLLDPSSGLAATTLSPSSTPARASSSLSSPRAAARRGQCRAIP